jgi:ankyrin repeat protein
MKWQLLHKACWEGDPEEVERLLKAGADPNQIAPTDWRQAPLGRTLEFRITSPRHAGHVETVRILLQYGAKSVNNELVNTRNVNSVWRKATPLMMAARHAAHFAVCDRLLNAGADPNAGTSILHGACDWHFEHLIPALQYLLRVGWNVNSRDSVGQTALHKAAFLGYSTVARALLKIGADPNAMDGSGVQLWISLASGTSLAPSSFSPTRLRSKSAGHFSLAGRHPCKSFVKRKHTSPDARFLRSAQYRCCGTTSSHMCLGPDWRGNSISTWSSRERF